MARSTPFFRSASSLRVLALAGLFVGLGGFLLPSDASARVQSLRWQESAPSTIAGFRVYTRDTASTFGVPAFDGLPSPDSSGVYQFDLTLPDAQTVIVAVTAYDASGNESVLSNERQYDGMPPASPAPGGGGNTQTIYRVNAGGTAYTDSFGNAWEPDSTYVASGVGTYFPNMNVNGTPDPFLYQSNRYENSTSEPMHYEFPVPDGNYLVRLHVVETWEHLQIGQRLYDVRLEGNVALNDFDILASAGAILTAHIEQFSVTVTDGLLSVHFDNEIMYPMLAALEVEPDLSGGSGGGTTPPPDDGTGGSVSTPPDDGGGTTTAPDDGGSTEPTPEVMGAPGQPQLVVQ